MFGSWLDRFRRAIGSVALRCDIDILSIDGSDWSREATATLVDLGDGIATGSVVLRGGDAGCGEDCLLLLLLVCVLPRGDRRRTDSFWRAIEAAELYLNELGTSMLRAQFPDPMIKSKSREQRRATERFKSRCERSVSYERFLPGYWLGLVEGSKGRWR